MLVKRPSLRITVIILAPIILMIFLVQSANSSSSLYVISSPVGNDQNECLTPATPCGTINAAIGKATAGDTVVVAVGTYYTNNGNEVVLFNKDIALSGGWNSTFTNKGGMSTIDGQGMRRGITVISGVTVSSERFVIKNGGNGGGGIYNGGTLTLDNYIIKANSGSSGAGIFNDGSLTINSSSIESNTVGRGIYNNGILLINSSTIKENGSGGIYCFSGDITLNNSTISGNKASGSYGGGMFINDGCKVHLNNCTINKNEAEYGGGLYNSYMMTGGSVAIQNTIVAKNLANNGEDCAGWQIISSGYNIIGNTTNCNFTPISGDLINIDPLLFPLVGSPSYHPLIIGSPAINDGNPGGCLDNQGNILTTDQRGIARAGRCDIGAIEFDPTIDHYGLTYLPIITKTYSKCGNQPTLISPSNLSNPNTLIPLFQWKNQNYSNAEYAVLQVAKDSDFIGLVVQVPMSPAAEQQFRSEINLNPSTTYYWRTFLECADKSRGPYSEVWSFTTGTGGTILPGPTLIAPGNGATIPPTNTTFQWFATGDAVEYTVWWKKSGDPIWMGLTTTNTQIVLLWSLSPSASYEWMVVPRNNYAYGNESVHWTFNTNSTGSLGLPMANLPLYK
jgi:hypothetical protein